MYRVLEIKMKPLKDFMTLSFRFFVCYNLLFSPLSYAKNISLTTVIKQTLKKENPYQVIFLTSDSIKRDVSNELSQVYDVPSLKGNLLDDSYFKGLESPDIENSFHKSLIIVATNDTNQVKFYIDSIVKRVPVHQRPKCLVVLNDRNYANLTHEVSSILKYAWSQKLLDFSIINMNRNENKIFVYYFDPFVSTLYKKMFQKQVGVFPDKFKRMKNYPINVTISTFDLHEKMKRGQKFRHYVKFDYTLRFMLQASNFDLKPVDGYYNRTDPEKFYPWRDALSWFKYGNANVHGVLLTRTDILLYSNFSDVTVIPSEQFCHQHFVSLVPVLRETITFSYEIFICSFSLITAILTFLFIMRKSDENYRKVPSFIKLLVGQPVNFKFHQITSKIIFLTIILLHVIISNEICSLIVKLKYVKNKYVIDDFEDLGKSELPVYSTAELEYVRINSDDSIFKTLNEKMKHTENCTEKLVNSRSMICIIDNTQAENAVNKYRNPDGSPMMYTATPYHCNDLFYIFEPASPYAILFTITVHKVQASGVLSHAINLYFGFMNPFKDAEAPKENDNHKIPIHNVLIILSSGFLLASLLFISELFIPKVRNHFGLVLYYLFVLPRLPNNV